MRAIDYLAKLLEPKATAKTVVKLPIYNARTLSVADIARLGATFETHTAYAADAILCTRDGHENFQSLLQIELVPKSTTNLNLWQRQLRRWTGKRNLKNLNKSKRT